MAHVELIYDPDCPNIARARMALLHAFARAGLTPAWTEWDRGGADSPAHVRGYGSPTILVNGRDVAGAAPGEGAPSCRLYAGEAGASAGAPAVAQIVDALRPDDPAASANAAPAWRSATATVPGIAFAALPKLACPACWPAYTGLLGALGLGFLLETTYLPALTAGFLALAVAALALRARARRGYGPLVLGAAAAGTILAGKFALASDATMYGGLAGLMAASLWSAPPGRTRVPSCPACARDSGPGLRL